MSEQGHHPNYTKIYITLVVLLCISVAGPHLGIFWVTLITAFGIALVKADLVIQNFMHLKVERRIVKWMLATSLKTLPESSRSGLRLLPIFFRRSSPRVAISVGMSPMKRRPDSWIAIVWR